MARSDARSAFLFLFPALAAIGVFFFIPVLAALFMSFTDFDIYSLADFSNVRLVGLENYSRLLEDPLFWKAMGNTFTFVIFSGPLSIAVSLTAALLLNNKLIKNKGLFRLSFFMPVVTTLVAVAVVWRYVYHPKYGYLNYILSFVGIPAQDWLGDTSLALPAIVLMSVWKNFGYNMIIFIAGLQNIPQYLYEAADIEGATAWDKFRNITLPMLAPTTVFITITTIIGYFQLFAEPYIMTQGGPLNSTLSIVQYMYQEGFRWWNMGYSTAIAFMLFLVIFAGTLIQLAIQKRKGAM